VHMVVLTYLVIAIGQGRYVPGRGVWTPADHHAHQYKIEHWG
jgi:hypothetical protein